MEKKLLIGLILSLVIIVFIPIYGITEPARQKAGAERQVHVSSERGSETFVSVCSVCHGPEGQGGVGPALKGTRLDRAALIEIITKGRTAKPISMPAWSQESGGPLKKHQVEDVVNFIQNWNPDFIKQAQAKHKAPASPPVQVESEDPVASQGKAYFISAGCSACHGPSAGGTAIAPDIRSKTGEEIIRQVRSPRTSAMPAFPISLISDADLDKIVTFIITLKK